MNASGLANFDSHTYEMQRFEDKTPVFLLPRQAEALKEDLAKSIEKIEL